MSRCDSARPDLTLTQVSARLRLEVRRAISPFRYSHDRTMVLSRGANSKKTQAATASGEDSDDSDLDYDTSLDYCPVWTLPVVSLSEGLAQDRAKARATPH